MMLLAEWTKFRTVRGWVIGVILAAVLFVVVGVLAAGGVSIGCGDLPKDTGRACLPSVPIGPGGEAVTDNFYFVRQPLAGDGTLTVRVTSLTGEHATGPGHVQVGSTLPMMPGLVPWAKAGIIIKASTKQGSAYAAMMVTGSHGVRMQYNYTGDVAGLPGLVSASAPRWLRLVRSGETITGYDSADGTHWSRVGVVTLAGLRRVAQVGLFAAAPDYLHISPFFGGASVQTGPSVATAVIDDVRMSGGGSGAPGSSWTGDAIGGRRRGPGGGPPGGFRQAGDRLTVTGSGDIAPAVPGPGNGFPTATIEQSLAGGFAALIAIIVVAAMFFTAEYRRGLIRTTLAASPRRGRVLAAKAAVAGVVGFVAGLVGAIMSIALGVPRESAEGLYVLPVSVFTHVRVIVGTALLVALAGVFAVALGAVLRRSAAAITVGIVAIVLPFLLSALGVFPAGVSAWMLRLTPAAGFAVEQSIPQYPQLSRVYATIGGFYPLPPLAGLAVLCAWVVAAMLLALYVLRRRDA